MGRVMVRAGLTCLVALAWLGAFAAPAHALTLDIAPAGISLPVTGQAAFVTTGSEVRISFTPRGNAQGVKVWSPLGWVWDGTRTISTGVHVQGDTLITGHQWYYHRATLPTAQRVSSSLRRRRFTHCGSPDTAGYDHYAALVTRNGVYACRDFKALGLRASAWLAAQSAIG